MKYEIKFTNQFKEDQKLAREQNRVFHESILLSSILTPPICCVSCADTVFPSIRMKKFFVTADFPAFGALFMKYSRKFFDMYDFCRNFILFPMRQILFHKIAFLCQEIAHSCHDAAPGLTDSSKSLNTAGSAGCLDCRGKNLVLPDSR